MISRVDVTRDLSKAVLKRLRREFTLVAQEVWVDDVHRVDFVGFKPFPMVSYPASLERGTFVFVEVKSCMDDYKSGHGLTFDGDVNWLVCTQELRDQLGYRIPYQASMLCPNKAGALTKVIEGGGHRSFRRASALELLWRMVNHSEACWRTSREVFCDGDEDE